MTIFRANRSISLRRCRYLVGVLVLPALSLFFSGCQTNKVPAYQQYAGQSAQQIFAAGTQAMRKHNYAEAIKRFEALDALYPFNANARQAQLNLIYSYYEQSDRAMTLAACDRYIRLYPHDKDVAYAYYVRGISAMTAHRGPLERFFPSHPAQRDLQGLEAAYRDFQLLLRAYPHSPYTPDAAQRMVYIRNVLAQHELDIADYYYRQHAYVAAANRANSIIVHYQQTPAIPSALVIMVRAYQQLGMTEEAGRAMEILKLNFPNSQYVAQVKG